MTTTKKSDNEKNFYLLNESCITLMEGNIYDFDINKKYGGYKDIANDILLIILYKITQEKGPSRKCDKNDILKAFQLAIAF